MGKKSKLDLAQEFGENAVEQATKRLTAIVGAQLKAWEKARQKNGGAVSYQEGQQLEVLVGNGWADGELNGNISDLLAVQNFIGVKPTQIKLS